MIVRLLITEVENEEVQQEIISTIESQFSVKVELEDVYSEDEDDLADTYDLADSCDYYENWDNLEMGFDPYMGSYSDDC